MLKGTYQYLQKPTRLFFACPNPSCCYENERGYLSILQMYGTLPEEEIYAVCGLCKNQLILTLKKENQ